MFMIVNEDKLSRTIGYKVNSAAGTIYGGTLLSYTKNATTGDIEVKEYSETDRTSSLIPLGIAIDPTYMQPIGPTDGSPSVAGQGYNYTDYNRGGLVAGFELGSLWIKGNSLVKGDDTWTVGKKVYWDPDGSDYKYTETSTNAVEIGVLMDKVTSGGSVTEILVKVKQFI